MEHIILSLIVLFFWSSSPSSLGGLASPIAQSSIQARSANTCADTSTTVPFIQQFSAEQNTFALNTAVGWAVGITQTPSPFWSYAGQTFLAWDPLNPDPENRTTGLWLYFDASNTDYAIGLAKADGSPPAIAGFTPQSFIAYVYSSQVCGSIPLLAAQNAAAGSHYYTTNVNEHTFLLTAAGWTDAGIAAYVLPVSNT